MSDNGNGMFVFLGAMRPFQPAIPPKEFNRDNPPPKKPFNIVPPLPHGGATAPVPGPQQLNTYRISYCAKFHQTGGFPLTETELSWQCSPLPPFHSTEAKAKFLFSHFVPGGMVLDEGQDGYWEYISVLSRRLSNSIVWVVVMTLPPQYLDQMQRW